MSYRRCVDSRIALFMIKEYVKEVIAITYTSDNLYYYTPVFLILVKRGVTNPIPTGYCQNQSIILSASLKKKEKYTEWFPTGQSEHLIYSLNRQSNPS